MKIQLTTLWEDIGVYENVIHASDSPETAEKEIKLWFTPDQLSELIYPITTEKTEIERTVWK